MSREDDRARHRPLAATRRRGRFLLRDLRWAVQHPAPRDPAVLFLFGAQRSGTTMLLDEFAVDPRVKVFDEYCALNRRLDDPLPWWDRHHTRRYSVEMLPLPEVAGVISHMRAPLVVSKPLVESDRAAALLDTVPRSRGVWLLREAHDVAGSTVRKFGPEISRSNLRPIAEDADDWRSRGVSPQVRDLVRRHLSPDLDPHDAGALFWLARNALYRDLDLHRDPRILLLRYEDLVADPVGRVGDCYDHLGAPRPARARTEIHPRSVGRSRRVALHPEIEDACAGLQEWYDALAPAAAR